jgi:hypothetical protein
MEEGGNESLGAPVGLGTQLPQLVGFVQQLHDPLLLYQRRYRNVQFF